MAEITMAPRIAAITVFCDELFRLNAWKKYYSARNKILVTKKHYGFGYALAEAIYNMMYMLSLATYHVFSFQFAKLSYAKLSIKAIFDGLRGKSGSVTL